MYVVGVTLTFADDSTLTWYYAGVESFLNYSQERTQASWIDRRRTADIIAKSAFKRATKFVGEVIDGLTIPVTSVRAFVEEA
jgi:hypothetical protein